MSILVDKFSDHFPANVTFEWFIAIQGDVFRNLDGRKTLRFIEQERSYFIKIHLGVGWREILKNFLQFKNPVLGAKNECLAIKWLEQIHVDTMTLVAYAIRGWNPAKLQSFVVTEELKNTISLEDYCAHWVQVPPLYSEKQLLIKKVAEIAKKMHESGMNHRDFYICHFLMENNRSIVNARLFLIDLHRAQIRKKVPERWLVKDLSALYFSAMHIGLSSRDLLRFMKYYRGCTVRDIIEKESMIWGKVKKKAKALNEMPERKKIR